MNLLNLITAIVFGCFSLAAIITAIVTNRFEYAILAIAFYALARISYYDFTHPDKTNDRI